MAKIQTTFVTDIGCKRAMNQDSGAASSELGFCIIADGMGGHRGGETASRLAVEKQVSFLENPADPQKKFSDRLIDGLREAHSTIFKLSQTEESLRGMGTTSTLLALEKPQSPAEAWIIHVGDSRCYLLRPGAIWQLTRDHSIVQEKLRAGLITRDQVKSDHMKNVITRSVGFENQLQPDVYQLKVNAGDVFLLCSDGLTGQVEDDVILEVVDDARNQNDWENCARRLIQLANENGGDDNISVAILHIGE